MVKMMELEELKFYKKIIEAIKNKTPDIYDDYATYIRSYNKVDVYDYIDIDGLLNFLKIQSKINNETLTELELYKKAIEAIRNKNERLFNAYYDKRICSDIYMYIDIDKLIRKLKCGGKGNDRRSNGFISES